VFFVYPTTKEPKSGLKKSNHKRGQFGRDAGQQPGEKIPANNTADILNYC
jgi:hypothetical protein